jgi:transposase
VSGIAAGRNQTAGNWFQQTFPTRLWNTREVYKVELYARARRAVIVDKMSEREAAGQFGLARETVRKMLRYSVPPGYRRQQPVRRPKLDAWTGTIDQILEQDKAEGKKQRHTAKRIFERLRDEHGDTGGYTIVKDYVRLRKRGSGSAGSCHGGIRGCNPNRCRVREGTNADRESGTAADNGNASMNGRRTDQDILHLRRSSGFRPVKPGEIEEYWRRRAESNRRIKVLQTLLSAL